MSKPKSLRARLTLTTAMAGALLISYGGRTSYAGSCPPVGGGTYFCSGGAVPGEPGVSIDYGGPVTVTTSGAPPAGFGIDTTGTGDTAISIKADGGLTFDDTNTYGSIITGDDDGLEAINTDGGAVTITTNGPVSGLGGEGITASNSSDGTDLTISAADVYGNQTGIKAINAGSGAIAVSAKGTVTGTAKYGIQAENTSASATDLTITAADVSGGQFGVRAINFGTGTLSITATGTVTGGQFQGIAARNLGTDLTISAQGVSGGSEGILALHEGTGSLSITAADTVTATTGTGIRAENSFNGANLTISAAGVSGVTSGIIAKNSGTGDLDVTATGLVTGTGLDGIYARNTNAVGGNLTISAAGVSGARHGIYTKNFGTGDLNITTTGAVTATTGTGIVARNNMGGAITISANDTVASSGAEGISALQLGNGGDLTISAAGVSGANHGITASNFGTGGLSITTTGQVTGGSQPGIRAVNTIGGGLSIVATEQVTSAAASGIDARSYSNDASPVTISAAAVQGNTYGINAKNGGLGDFNISATGTVTGATQDGIRAINSGSGASLTISAAGVSGGRYGIYARNEGSGDLKVTATGPVVGQGGYGISARNVGGGGEIVVTAYDTVTGNNYGISARNYGDGSITVTATDTVIATGGIGISTRAQATSTDTTISAAGVEGASIGVRGANYTTGNLSITTTGAVTGGTGAGIQARSYIGGGATVMATSPVTSASQEGIDARAFNDSTGLSVTAMDVQGQTDGIGVRNYGNGDTSVTATGTVTGVDGKGITALTSASTNNLTINANAINSEYEGIAAYHQGTGNLTVTADGTVTNDKAEGIDARITNAASGGAIVIAANEVKGGATGIAARHEGTGAIEITANGTVFGGFGNNASGGGIIAQIVNDSSTADVTVTADDVTSKQNGIEARNEGAGSVTVIADGLITTANVNSDGIRAENFIDGDVTVSAASVDGERFGILASNRGDGSIYVSASGTVTGRTGDGILAADPAGSNGLNVAVSAADVHGGVNGIVAQNIGTGFLSVTAGNVTGELLEGVRASLINGTDATVSVGDVSAGRIGISASNRGDGSLSITAGNVTGGLGGNGDGIFANLDTEGDTLTISAASVSGADTGISARNEGTGNLSITTTGPVTGGAGYGIKASNYYGGALTITAEDTVSSATLDGIRARNEADATDVTVAVAGVSGAVRGIDVRNVGTGDVSITATGMVTSGLRQGIQARNINGGDITIRAEERVSSASWDGISATNNDGGGALTISAAGVDGGRSGIRAEHQGTGALSITAGGDVTGDTTEGIFARIDNAASGAHLTISAMGVSGGTDGIDAENLGSGSIFVTTSGPVTGDGNGYGIRVENSAGGDVSITAADIVWAPGTGIAGRNFGPMAGNVTITAAGVTGLTGILANSAGSGSVSVTATGTVTGTGLGSAGINASGAEIEISTMDVIGGARGISARNSGMGSTIIDADGTVTGLGNIGLYAYNAVGSGNISVSAMDVEGGTFGILARSRADGSISVVTSGDVTGALSDGIRADAASTNATQVTVAAQSVFGEQRGIDARNSGTGHLEVVAEGTATGGQREGIRARITNTDGGGDLTVSAADVSGGSDGVVATNKGTGALMITSTGAVTGGTYSGIVATIDNPDSTSDISISVVDVTGNESGIALEHGGKGQFFMTIDGAVAGNYGPGIGIVDINDGGGVIVIGDTGSVASNTGLAISDQDGSAVVVSRGALVGDVMLNGGADTVALIDGSATGLIGLGIENDTMQIFGVVAGGGWDDADFSGTFDGNLGQVLQIDGGDGLDTVELFGVTAASQALGVPTGLEALALSANTLVQANDADLTPFGAVFVDPSSTLQAEGNSPSSTVVGSLGNEGGVDLADGEANDVLRVSGDYAGATGSQVLLDFEADGATSDMFIIEGDVTDVSVGPFTVIHDRSLIDVNLIGAGSRTTGDGIRLIEVSGAVDGDDFALAGPVEGGIFGYELAFEDGAHFLRSDFFDQIYLYENLPGAMQTIGLALTGQLVERVGVRSAVPSTLAGADGNPVAGGAPVDTAIWGRAVGLSVESEGDLDSITGTSFDQTIGFVQAGVDVTVLERQSGRLLIGALGHWGTSSLDANTFDGDDAGSANFDFYGGGLTATWYSTRGWYFDNVVQYTAYDIDISTASRFASTSTDGYAITTSHELGYRIPISETAALVPQAQLTYQHIDFDDFTDPDGVRISLDDADSLIGRAGFAFENSAAIGSALATGYLEANVLHEFLGDNSVNVAAGFGTTPISQETRGTSVELGFGGTVAVSRGVSLYAEVDYTIPFDNGVQGVQALGGIRVNLNPPPPPPLPAPVIAPVAETAFIVFFDWDRAELTSEANLVLDEVAVVANETGYASIRLDSYTDLSGSAAYNLGLSERRANSVANGLIARGIAPDEIVIRAFGEENPLVPTPDGVREPQNRRVEIFLS